MEYNSFTDSRKYNLAKTFSSDTPIKTNYATTQVGFINFYQISLWYGGHCLSLFGRQWIIQQIMFQHSIFRLCFYIVFSIWNNRTFSAICQSCLWEQLEVIMWRSIHHIKSITIHLIPIHLGSDCQKAALPTEIAHICWHFNLSESIPIHLKPPDFTSFHPNLSESISLRPQPPESISTYLNPDCQNAALQTEIAHAPTNPSVSVTNRSRLLRWVKTRVKQMFLVIQNKEQTEHTCIIAYLQTCILAGEGWFETWVWIAMQPCSS